LAEFKIVVSDPKIGKSITKEIKDKSAQTLLGMKIGQEIDATIVDIDGTLKITGGSDKVGFPLRGDVHGSAKNNVLLTDGVGFRSKIKGMQKRKIVRGNMISDETYQINTILVKGNLVLDEAPAEESKEAPAEESKEAPAEDAPAKE
tara:strand:+ start:14391 stop:14831 length:441 start_codon:yes stop_codon:yes gene_type:complete